MLITACEDKYNKLWTSSMALWFVFLIKVNVTYTKNCWLASGFSSLGKDNHGLWKWTRSLACLRKPGCLNRVGVWLKKQEGSGGSQMEAGTPGGERCGREAPLRTPAWSALLNGSKHRAPKLQSATAPGGWKCEGSAKERTHSNEWHPAYGESWGKFPIMKLLFSWWKCPQKFSLLGEVSPNEKTAL